MVECTQRAAAANPQPSGNVTVRSLHYQRLGGAITLTPANMPLQQDAWSALAAYTQVRGANGCLVRRCRDPPRGIWRTALVVGGMVAGHRERMVARQGGTHD